MKISKSWIVLLVAGVIGWTLAQEQQAIVPNRHVNSKKGVAANFTCESQGLPINVCLWERFRDAASNLLVTFTGSPRVGSQGSRPGYTYLGDGLEKGACGLNINRVEDNDNGNWQCTLITTTGSIFRGNVNLSILQKPTPPQFESTALGQLSRLEEETQQGRGSQPEKIICFTTNGVPRPKFEWFIGDDRVVGNFGPVNETKGTGQTGDTTFIFQELRNYKFTFKDNGKKLRCVLVHDALSENDAKETSTPITIYYRPRSVRSDGRENDRSLGIQADLGTEKVIFLNITSNPAPNRVTWTVDGKALEQGQSNDQYEAIVMKQVAQNVYEIALKIRNVDEEDLQKKIDLRIVNERGTAEYMINVQTSASGSGGLNAGGILGIILAILAILIIIAASVVYTRARGMLCFKGDDGTASEKERMDGGSTGGGTVTVEDKPPSRGLSSRLSALYENLVAKKKDKGAAAPVDEEAPKEKDGKEKDGVEGETVPDPEKKGDDIVYAELDLARSAPESQRPEVVVRTDDKTEYAEIVGVVAKDEPKKSPEASPKK